MTLENEAALNTLTTVLNAIWSNISSTVTTISQNPLLLIALAGVFVALVIDLTQKLMGIRRRKDD